MRIRDQHSDEEEPINLMPLIDMVFLLLIFFLVATTIAQDEREVSIQLPATADVQPLSAPPKQVIINIDADGTPNITGRAYDDAALLELLEDVARNEPGREVLIRADERSLHRYFARAASICRQAGVDEVKIGYILQPPSPTSVE
jgi:biopolymer transport protein ExbD